MSPPNPTLAQPNVLHGTWFLMVLHLLGTAVETRMVTKDLELRLGFVFDDLQFGLPV